MDAQIDVGKPPARGVFLRHSNVQRREFEEFLRCASVGCSGGFNVLAFTTARRAKEFFEALEEGDAEKADKVLRLWRIR